MATPATDAVLEETLRRVGRLEVRARRVVDGFLSGRHRSPYRGRSLEFREHRQYARGDDLRHVDWKVWGRQDRLYVKQFEAETNLRALLLIDTSASMAYPLEQDERLSKHDYATTAACALAYLLTRQHDAVGCLTFAEEVSQQIPTRNHRTQPGRIAEAIAPPAEGAKTALASAFRAARNSLSGRGMVILFSDLLAPVDELEEGLSLLRTQGADPLVLQILDDDELDFPFDRPSCFVGLESDHELNANPRALRLDYLEALDAHLAAIRTVCAKHGADYRLVRTSEPLDAVLVAMLTTRR